MEYNLTGKKTIHVYLNKNETEFYPTRMERVTCISYIREIYCNPIRKTNHNPSSMKQNVILLE